MSRHDKRPAPAECPVCGTAVPPKALSCPQCGADEHTGWNEDATPYDGLDLPDSAYEDEPASFSRGKSRRSQRHGPHPLWIVIGVALLVWFAYRALSPF